MAKILAVFVDTDIGIPIGQPFVRLLSGDPTFKVRMIVPKIDAKQQEDANKYSAELVQADKNNLNSLVSALQGAYGCFVMTETDFSKPIQHEIQQGKNLADACARTHVQHVIYRTAWPVHKALGVPAQNCDAKAEIEQYMRSLELPLSFVTVPILYESLMTDYKPVKDVQSGGFMIALPIGGATIDMMSVEDIAPVVCNMFSNREHFLNKTVCMSAEKMTVGDIAQVLNRQLQPLRFRDRQITVDEYRNLGFPGSMDIANMFDCYARNEQRSSIDSTLRLNPELQKFEFWVPRCKPEIMASLQEC